MVKSKPSMTSTLDKIKSGELIHTMAGNYPSSMDALVDSNGHISLDAADYKDYSREEVETFLASRGYETHLILDQDGEIVSMDSQWRGDKVKHNLTADSLYIRRAGSDGAGFTDMHTHPFTLDDGQVQVFSPSDIKSYVRAVGYRDDQSFPMALPTKFRVVAGDGSFFELEYVGGGQRATKNMKTAYTRAFNSEMKRMDKEPYLSVRGQADEVTSGVNEWLSENAGKYGFRYNTNWTSKPIR